MIDISAWLSLPEAEDRDGGTLSSDFPLFFFVTVSKKSLKSQTFAISQISFKSFSLFCVVLSFCKNICQNNFGTPTSVVYFSIVFKKSRKTVPKMEIVPAISISWLLLFRVRITEFRYYYFGNLMTEIFKRTSFFVSWNINKMDSFDSKTASRRYHMYHKST